MNTELFGLLIGTKTSLFGYSIWGDTLQIQMCYCTKILEHITHVKLRSYPITNNAWIFLNCSYSSVQIFKSSFIWVQTVSFNSQLKKCVYTHWEGKSKPELNVQQYHSPGEFSLRCQPGPELHIENLRQKFKIQHCDGRGPEESELLSWVRAKSEYDGAQNFVSHRDLLSWTCNIIQSQNHRDMYLYVWKVSF